MRKISLLFAVVIAFFMANTAVADTAMNLFSSDFEQSTNGYVSKDWNCFGAGYEAAGYIGSTPNKTYFPSDKPNYLIYGLGDYVAAFSNSTTVESTGKDKAGKPVDEWLVTPAIEVKDDALMLQFVALAFGGMYYTDSYCKFSVYVSTTGNTKEDFTGEPILEQKLSVASDASTYVVRAINTALKGYKDQKIWIAFVNQSDGTFMTGFADITVDKYAIRVTDKTEPYITEPGTEKVKMAVKIKTPFECKGFTAKLEASDGSTGEWSNTKELSKAYSTYNIEFPGVEVKNQGESVSYKVTITPNVEGATSTVVTGKVAYAFSYPAMAVMEEPTGQWCGWCTRGMAAMEKFANDYGDNFVAIAVHNSDMMTVADYDGEITELISGFPSAVINRRYVTDPGAATSSIESIINNGGIGKVEITKGIYDENKGEMEFEFNTTIGYTSNDMTMSVAAVIIEDNVKGEVSGWWQNNYYATASQTNFSQGLDGTAADWWPYMQKFCSGGEWGAEQIPSGTVEFDHVAWGIFNSYYGMPLSKDFVVNEAKAGKINFVIPYTGNGMHPQTGVSQDNGVQNVENTSVVLLLIDDATGEIVNADVIKYSEMEKGEVSVESTKLSKYVVSQDGNMLVVNAEEGAVVTVYSVDGKLLASYEMNNTVETFNGFDYEGVVMVRIQKGNESSFRKLMWK